MLHSAPVARGFRECQHSEQIALELHRTALTAARVAELDHHSRDQRPDRLARCDAVAASEVLFEIGDGARVERFVVWWGPLAITALRHEVLVPAGVDDSFADPWLLGGLIVHGLAREAAGITPVCCYWTVSDPGVVHLHEHWREGRDVVTILVDRFAVPMVLVQHAPEQKLRHNPPHLHVVAACRTLGSRGFGAPVSDLIGDGARQLFFDAWCARLRRG